MRVTAIQLLVALSAAPEGMDEALSASSSPLNSPVVKLITPLATRFMGLLQDESLRPSVVELLSSLATAGAGAACVLELVAVQRADLFA